MIHILRKILSEQMIRRLAEKRGALIGLADFTELMNWINNYKF